MDINPDVTISKINFKLLTDNGYRFNLSRLLAKHHMKHTQLMCRQVFYNIGTIVEFSAGNRIKHGQFHSLNLAEETFLH